MPITRLGLDGYGVHRAGSFVGKTPSGGGGAHPVKRITRLGPDGYGVKREGAFAGKVSGGGGGAHPVAVLTRLALDGYGARREGSFGAKRQAEVTTTVAPVVATRPSGGWIRKRKKGRGEYDFLNPPDLSAVAEVEVAQEPRPQPRKTLVVRKAVQREKPSAPSSELSAQQIEELRTLMRAEMRRRDEEEVSIILSAALH